MMTSKKNVNFNFIIIVKLIFVNGLLCALPNQDQYNQDQYININLESQLNIDHAVKSNQELSDVTDLSSLQEYKLNVPLEQEVNQNESMFDSIMSKSPDEVDSMPEAMFFLKDLVSNSVDKMFKSYSEFKAAIGAESDSIISKRPDDVDQMPKDMCFVKDLLDNGSNEFFNRYNDLKVFLGAPDNDFKVFLSPPDNDFKVFLSAPEKKKSFLKNMNDLAAHVNGVLTRLGADTLYWLTGKSYKDKIYRRYQKNTIEMENGLSRSVEDNKTCELQALMSQPDQSQSGLCVSVERGNHVSSWLSLSFYMKNKGFLVKSMSAGMLVVGLSAFAYNFRHKVKFAFLKIQKFLLRKINEIKGKDSSDDLDDFEN